METTSVNGSTNQRATTPNMDSGVRGKMLSYQARRNRGSEQGRSTVSSQASNYRNPKTTLVGVSIPVEINIQGRSAVGGRGMMQSGSRQEMNSVGYRYMDQETRDQSTVSSLLPRHDLIPVTEEIPQDGVIFTRMKNHPEILVVFRTTEERSRNSERLNLDRRQLDSCPLLEQEQKLRLLNFQNNMIRTIQNLENLPNLIFLDLYNNKLSSLDGPLSCVSGLRVLMAGKNRITNISNLTNLRKLDVLDLHSNEIREIEGLTGLLDLRVLNLAGNRISIVKNLSSLQSLTELNLRRNCIHKIFELDKIPSLQRIFLSHNLITSFDDINCLFSIKYLIEISLDGNPLSEHNAIEYRKQIIINMPGLRHLDLKRVTEDERGIGLGTGPGLIDGNSSGNAGHLRPHVLNDNPVAHSHSHGGHGYGGDGDTSLDPNNTLKMQYLSATHKQQQQQRPSSHRDRDGASTSGNSYNNGAPSTSTSHSPPPIDADGFLHLRSNNNSNSNSNTTTSATGFNLISPKSQQQQQQQRDMPSLSVGTATTLTPSHQSLKQSQYALISSSLPSQSLSSLAASTFTSFQKQPSLSSINNNNNNNNNNTNSSNNNNNNYISSFNNDNGNGTNGTSNGTVSPNGLNSPSGFGKMTSQSNSNLNFKRNLDINTSSSNMVSVKSMFEIEVNNFHGHDYDFFKLMVVCHLILYIPVNFVIMRYSLVTVLSGLKSDNLGFTTHSVLSLLLLAISTVTVLALLSTGLTSGAAFGLILNLTGGIG
eukprot:gene11389-23833_t